MKWKNLEKIKNWELGNKKSEDIRVRALKGLGLFFLCMILLTLLSRAARNLTIPQAETVQAQSGKLEYKVSVTGQVKENKVLAVTAMQGIRIADIPVREGDTVSVGDTLFCLDLEDLREQIFEKEREIEKLDLGLKDIGNRRKSEQQERKVAQERAAEDYQSTEQSQNEAVQRAYDAMTEAEQELLEYKVSQGADVNRQTDIVQEDLGKTGEDEQAAEEPDLAGRLKELEASYQQKKDAYEDAQSERTRSITAAQRQIEDSGKQEAADSSSQITEIDRAVLAEELDKMEALLAEGGIIKADADGVVMEISIETGNNTLDGKNMTIADTTAGSLFVAQITKEQRKLIEKGDEVILEQSPSKEPITGLKIQSIRESKTDSEISEVTVEIPENQLEIGSTASMAIQKKSVSYGCTIPISALHSESNQYFVLVPEETQTVLGNELVARKVYVEVLEKNGSMAALKEDNILAGQTVITGADKPIKEGDGICVKEENGE